VRPRLYISTLLVFFSLKGVAQDTIIVSPKIQFSSDVKYNYFSKGYHGEYGREDIQISENHKKIDYCYYEDEVRICKSTEYKIVNDSTLWISFFDSWKNDSGSVVWTFRKIQDDKYYIYRQDSTFHESGYAKSLIPLTIDGVLTTTLANRVDTLWYLNYKLKSYLYSSVSFEVDFHKTKINEKIFEYFQIDSPPTKIDGDSIPAIEISAELSNTRCMSQPMRATSNHTMACVITKNGNIANIELAYGQLSNSCPYLLMEVVYKIQSFEKLKPATKKDDNVNVRWFIPVKDIEPANNLNHPAFQDSHNHRRQYIKRKKG
jgi:hypothetical protein